MSGVGWKGHVVSVEGAGGSGGSLVGDSVSLGTPLMGCAVRGVRWLLAGGLVMCSSAVLVAAACWWVLGTMGLQLLPCPAALRSCSLRGC
jgi:hypothetical protein